MASICITTEDDEVTPTSSSLSPGGLQAARQQPQATIPLSSVATLNLPTANTARKHLGTTKKSESRHLHPGYSMFDWTHYTQSAGDLTGVGGQLKRISAEELAKHDTEEDAWTVVRGVVYNITPFMKYHPGGKAQLMRGAGNDCTQLFDKIHIWVNSESILQKCIVGVYTGAPASSSAVFPLKLGSSLTAKQATKATSSSTAEEEEPAGVIALAVPSMTAPTTTTSSSESSVTLAVPINTATSAAASATSSESSVMLAVPTVNATSAATSSPEYSDYLVTTYNSVTGYETSV